LAAFEFVVAPGAARPPPDALIEKEQIPHKWLRLFVDLGTLRIDLRKDEQQRQLDLTEFNKGMRDRILKVIEDEKAAFPASTARCT
jgi:hypothetical protein